MAFNGGPDVHESWVVIVAFGGWIASIGKMLSLKQ
jgi:hypothetical protein